VGVVTSFVLQSDDLDEIDWEWLGGDATEVQTNYFSKGCTETYDRGGFAGVSDPINNFHTYTIKWTSEQLDWIIDGAVVRTLKNTGVSGCSGYPQSPMQIKLGTWVAGRKGAPQGTIDWAGGITDFADAPFDGYYQSLKVQDYMGGQGATEATEYVYTDRSGNWQSIKVVNDGSDSSSSTTKSSTAKSTSTTSKATSKTASATTLSTLSSSAVESSTSASATHGSNSTTTSATGSSTTTSTPTASPSTGAAGKLALSIGNIAAVGAAVGAAAMLGYLVL
jgi:beta-glucanase (GH16 family)